MDLIIGILITGISYMFYPFLKFKIINKRNKYTNKKINKICALNSIFIALLFLIISENLIESYKPNFIPAFMWYGINCSIYMNVDFKKEKKESKIAKYIVIIGGTFLIGCFILGIILSKETIMLSEILGPAFILSPFIIYGIRLLRAKKKVRKKLRIIQKKLMI